MAGPTSRGLENIGFNLVIFVLADGLSAVKHSFSLMYLGIYFRIDRQRPLDGDNGSTQILPLSFLASWQATAMSAHPPHSPAPAPVLSYIPFPINPFSFDSGYYNAKTRIPQDMEPFIFLSFLIPTPGKAFSCGCGDRGKQTRLIPSTLILPTASMAE
jgi:hypothetical protein